MLHRALAIPLHRAALLGEPVLVHGPRGGGKTHLLRHEFPAHTYLALDEPGHRTLARRDPATFLARLRGPAIIDDLHRAPELIAHLCSAAPALPLLLASSRRLRLPFQTFELHAPTQAERDRRPPVSLEMLGRFVPIAGRVPAPASRWPAGRDFLTNDVRDMVRIHEPDRFEFFLQAALSRSGEILDQQALATECGVSHSTVTRWLAVLEACFQILYLPPADVDFGRRVIQRPKLHFLDSECFASRVVWEIYRNARHAGDTPDLRYWRDSNGFEIPLIVQSDEVSMLPVGIAAAPAPTDVGRLRRWMELAGVRQAALIAQQAGAARSGNILRYEMGQL